MQGEFNQLIKKIYDFKGLPILAAAVSMLFLLEKLSPLRKRTLPVLKRLKTNAVVAALAGLGMRIVIIPVIVRAARYGTINRLGLLNRLPLSGTLRPVAEFLLLDYGTYHWHRLNHRSTMLWRFHQVHHADLDLDVTTALRFHIGEVLISAVFRGAWALFSGVSSRMTLIYEVVFELATNFHHTNLRIPGAADGLLAQFIVTPRMHGIHHSVIRDETDSNYSVVLTLWDRLHQTFRLDIPQEAIDIGIPYVRRHLESHALMLMPFRTSQEWKFPDGTVPARI